MIWGAEPHPRVRWAFFWLAMSAVILLGPGAGSVRAAAGVELEDRVREISSELRCVVCQNLSVADSPSDLAKEMRNVVREQVQGGKSSEEIQAYFVSRYGEYVLLSPPKRGFNLVVWGLPFLAIAAVGGVELNGPPARHFQAGDKIIVLGEAWIEPAELAALDPQIVIVEGNENARRLVDRNKKFRRLAHSKVRNRR